jgi:hypothetical protein
MTEEDITTEHPQVCITVGGDDIEVDEELAELITLMNGAGIHTIMSCQDNDGGRGTARRVWVDVFADDLIAFLEILDRPGEVDDWESLSCRIACEYEPDDWQDYRENRSWHYALCVDRIDGELGDLTVGVRFPHTDLSEVVARLGAWRAETT